MPRYAHAQAAMACNKEFSFKFLMIKLVVTDLCRPHAVSLPPTHHRTPLYTATMTLNQQIHLQLMQFVQKSKSLWLRCALFVIMEAHCS